LGRTNFFGLQLLSKFTPRAGIILSRRFFEL
jgi:hypothetical protein